MATSEAECLDALREAREQLGESPTKKQYEDLGLTPAASTILRVVGGWNEAKERAGLETNASRGSRVAPKPDDVEIPDDETWNDLSQDQRWHYRNVEWNTERTLRRRARLRAWLNERKSDRGCADCGVTDPACLDFHHANPDEKEMDVTRLVTYGYGKDRLRDEIDSCDVLCANCHRTRHHGRPAVRQDENRPQTKRERLQLWACEYQRERGCARCSERDPVRLQFHHPDPSAKSGSVGQLISNGADAERVRAEAERCVVLCVNCHRKEHFEPPQAGFDDVENTTE